MLTPRQLAVSVTGVFALTGLVGIAKPVERLRPGTVTVAGGWTSGLLLVMLMTAPSGGASQLRSMKPVACAPPTMLFSNRLRFASDAGCTVTVNVADVSQGWRSASRASG